jgi:O-antigen/teichoic acid export membrane protein
MSKATEMAKVSVKGGFHLLWGLVASTVISAIGTIVIAKLLGAGNYGLYSIALTAPALISNFRDWGINTAMIRYSAQYNSEKDVAKIRSIFLSGLAFEVILGFALSFLCFVLSSFLAVTLHRPAIAQLIQILSLSILTGGLVNAAYAAFTGLETMHLYSITLIIQSLVKYGLIVALLVLGLGTVGAVTGYTAGALIAGLTGILLMRTMYKSLPQAASSKLEMFGTIKTMFNYGLPVSIGNVLTTFLSQFYIIILAIYVTNNVIIGNYSLAVYFTVLITFFATPVTTMMFPAFSKLDPQRDNETLKNVFQYSVKYAALIVVPITAIVMALAQPGVGTIFGNAYTEAPLFLVLTSITYLYSAFGSLSASNLIIGQGYTTYNMWLSILIVVIGFPLSFLLISNFGVIGLIVTSLTVSLPSLFLSLRFIKNRFGVSVDWASSGKILLSSTIAAILTYILTFELAFSNPVKLVVGIIGFCVIFIAATLFTGTVKRADLINMKETTDSLGPFRGPLRSLLDLLDKLIVIFHLDEKPSARTRDV